MKENQGGAESPFALDTGVRDFHESYCWIQLESKRFTHFIWSWENANNVQEYFYTDVNEND